MTRPMSEEERERALKAAAATVESYTAYDFGMSPANELLLARALLSTSAAVRGMREAAIALNDEIDRMWNDVHRFNPPNWESHAKAISEAQQRLYAALSSKGGG